MQSPKDEKNSSSGVIEKSKPDRENIDKLIRLSQNENPLGASPNALKAMMDNYSCVNRYPAFTPSSLERQLSEKYCVSNDRVLFAAGSSEIVNMIIQTLDDSDSNIVTSELSFAAYRLFAKAHNRECRLAKIDNFTLDLDNMLALCDEKTKVVFIANPNNPTGTIITHKQLCNFLNSVSPEILVVVDEAYAEYVKDDTYPDSFNLMKEYPNYLMLRTFSKIYGLAGLRIGYAIGDKKVIENIGRVKIPYSVNTLAFPAASASLDDTEYIDKCSEFNAREREKLYTELISLGYQAVPTQANFLFVNFPEPDEKDNMFNCLLQNNLLVRKEDNLSGIYALRISIGMEEQNKKIIECFRSNAKIKN